MNASNRMLRSPSHESVSTEISVLSLTSLNPFLRIPSPIPDTRHRLAVPGSSTEISGRSSDIWAEEENDLIKNFGALFKILGVPKSFSTSDICHTFENNGDNVAGYTCGLPLSGISASIGSNQSAYPLRKTNSELDFSQIKCSDIIFRNHFGPASRSCSTWVAVGDVSSTSQLPSPQGRPNPASNGGSFTPADLVRSVNKKIRQLYIRKRLIVAYKALERLTQSDFDLEKLPVLVPNNSLSYRNTGAISTSASESMSFPIPVPKPGLDNLSLPSRRKHAKELPLTLKDVERERGRPLSKFERNMMIFNWLHTLDEDYEDIE